MTMTDPKYNPAIAALIEAARSAGCKESEAWIVESAVQLATEVWKARAEGQDPVFYDAHSIKSILDAKVQAAMAAEQERQRQGGTVH